MAQRMTKSTATHDAAGRLSDTAAQLAAALAELAHLRAKERKRAVRAAASSRQYYYGPAHETQKRKRREYYHRNKEHLRRKVPCPRCGRMITHLSRASHWRSARCKREAAAIAERTGDLNNS